MAPESHKSSSEIALWGLSTQVRNRGSQQAKFLIASAIKNYARLLGGTRTRKTEPVHKILSVAKKRVGVEKISKTKGQQQGVAGGW